MRIGLVAPPWIPVPPPAYGGTEAVFDGHDRLRRRMVSGRPGLVDAAGRPAIVPEPAADLVHIGLSA